MDGLNQVVKAALVGSARADIKPLANSLPEEIQAILQQQNIDTPEEELIQVLSLAVPYFNAGGGLATYEKKIKTAAAEPKPYASHDFTRILRDILQNPVEFLMGLWAKKCAQSGKIVQADLIPELLTFANKNKEFLFILQDVMGERGKWLANQHEDWKENHVSPGEAWEIGSLAVRKAAFQVFLVESKEKAMQLLNESWKELSAADRLYFFQQIKEKLDRNDLLFLEKLSTDRSKLIKKEARAKLFQTPGHVLYDELKTYIQSSLEVESKGIWGFKSKHISINPASISEELEKGLSLEPESLDKKFTDEEYRFKSVLEYGSLDILSEKIELDKKKVLEQFFTHKDLEKYGEALIQNIIQTKNSDWGEVYFELMDDKEIAEKKWINFGREVIEVLSTDSLKRLFKQNKLNWVSESTIATLARIQVPWDLNFTRTALFRLKKEYMESGIVYTQVEQMGALAEWMSPEIISGLDTYLPPAGEKKESWRSALALLSKNLILKQRIIELNP